MIKLLISIVLLSSCYVQAASWQVTYPRHSATSASIDEYPLLLLSLALDQTGVNYQLLPSENALTKTKALDRLQDNREINIVWGMTNTQREEDLLPIRIPIFKGLIGWRLLLIRRDMAERFQYIQTIDNLVKLSPLQGRDWADTKILQSNGFNVVIDSSPSVLLDMLANAQGDFFPRSIIEIWDELNKSPKDYQLKVQPSLGITYPAAIYFFVNKKSVPLANLIEVGLEKAITSGKFEALFLKHYQQYIDRANIKNRDFYRLENTFLPDKTPLDRKELWFNSEVTLSTKK